MTLFKPDIEISPDAVAPTKEMRALDVWNSSIHSGSKTPYAKQIEPRRACEIKLATRTIHPHPPSGISSLGSTEKLGDFLLLRLSALLDMEISATIKRTPASKTFVSTTFQGYFSNLSVWRRTSDFFFFFLTSKIHQLIDTSVGPMF